MTTAEIHTKLKSQFGERIADLTEDAEPSCTVEASSIAAVCEWLRDEPGIDLTSLMCLSAVDNNETLGVVYHLHSIKHNHRIALKVELSDRENPHVPTVSTLFGTADWHEREAYDMMGIIFDGHHDLRRILCPDDWEGWPLRKDYVVQEYYRGLKVPYPEGKDANRGHWVSRDVPDRRADPPELSEPDLKGM